VADYQWCFQQGENSRIKGKLNIQSIVYKHHPCLKKNDALTNGIVPEAIFAAFINFNLVV
jgi:hypothetical protein